MRSSAAADRHCERVALSQFGAISRDQLRQTGLSDRAIEIRVKSGYLVPLYPGVFRLGAAPPSREQALRAALLWAGSTAFFTKRTAATIYELDGAASPCIDIAVPSGRTCRGLRTYRYATRDRPRIRLVRGWPVPVAERTLLDYAAVSTLPRTGLALEDALRKRITSLDRLWAEIYDPRNANRPGRRNLKRLVEGRDDRDGRLASKFEAKMMAILKNINDKEVFPQFQIANTAGGSRYFLDFAYPNEKLGIEAQSLRWHFGEERWKKDLARDRHLSLQGWTILYFTWDDVCFRPQEVEAEIRAGLQMLTVS